jgi:hypothetical protein
MTLEPVVVQGGIADFVGLGHWHCLKGGLRAWVRIVHKYPRVFSIDQAAAGGAVDVDYEGTFS